MHQFNDITEQSEIVRDQIVTLVCRKKFARQQDLYMSVMHKDPAHSDHVIKPCPNHQCKERRRRATISSQV